MTPAAARLPRSLTVAFGLVVITAFGSWFYGFGVLLQPILSDTGWAETEVSAAYGIALLAAGMGAVAAGRATDRLGARPVFLAGAAGVALGTVVAVTASAAPVFIAGAVVAHGFVGAVGYYTVVHATIAALAPGDRTRAITVNTLWGAFASPVFLPLLAWLALAWGWREAMAVASASVAAAFLLAAAIVPRRREAEAVAARRSMLGDLVDTVRDPLTRRLLVVAVGGGIVSSVLFLYQVPAMVTAGLGLAAASTLAGLRGLFQLLGRLPLPWLVGKVGARPVFQASLALVGLGSLLLLVSGEYLIALVFVVVVGAAVGAYSTLESIYVTELVDLGRIGIVLGAYSMVRGIGSAIGPVGAGALTEASGTRAVALAAIAAIAIAAALVVPRKRADDPA